MQGIYNGFQTLINMILAPIRFLIDIINWSTRLYNIINKIIENLIELTITIPQWLITYIMIGITIIVIYQILGRETGK